MYLKKRLFLPVLTSTCFLLAVAPLPAQEPSETDMAAMMAAGQPGEHHEHMAFLEGSWNVAATFWMPGAPDPMETKGESTYEWVLGGRYMHQSYTGDFMGMKFEGIGVTGYDTMGKKYVATWTDNMNTAIMSETGQCDGTGKKTEWKGQIPDPASGEMVSTRTVHIVESNDKFVMTSYAIGPDGTESPMMKLVYTRK